MDSKTIFKDLGVIDYKQAWDYQEELLKAKIDYKTKGENPESGKPQYILYCEHPHVYTLGKSGTENNLLINSDFLSKINATYYRINRGGDITYHGPGQIVGYPIIDLEKVGMGVKKYIWNMEEAVIQTLLQYGITSERFEGATGVWLDADKPTARKICAIGVRVSRYVTMHGFAFNVNTNLEYYNHINPCGFTDKGVTSMEKELAEKQDFQAVKDALLINLYKSLRLE